MFFYHSVVIFINIGDFSVVCGFIYIQKQTCKTHSYTVNKFCSNIWILPSVKNLLPVLGAPGVLHMVGTYSSSCMLLSQFGHWEWTSVRHVGIV